MKVAPFGYAAIQEAAKFAANVSSRRPKRRGSGGVGVNTIVDSVQQEDSGEGKPDARGARIYKGPAESRSELCRSIVTMVQPSESLL
jgi:hypothetical protein